MAIRPIISDENISLEAYRNETKNWKPFRS